MARACSLMDPISFLFCKWHYVGVFPLAGHSSGIKTTLIYLRKKVFLGRSPLKPGWNSIRAIRFVCFQPAKLLVDSTGVTGCDIYCSNSRNRIYARIWDILCFFVVENTGKMTVSSRFSKHFITNFEVLGSCALFS